MTVKRNRGGHEESHEGHEVTFLEKEKFVFFVMFFVFFVVSMGRLS